MFTVKYEEILLGLIDDEEGDDDEEDEEVEEDEEGEE